MTTQMRPDLELRSPAGLEPPGGPRRFGTRRTLWAVLALAAIVAAVVIVAFVRRDDTVSTTPTTSPAASTPATSAPATSAPATSAPATSAPVTVPVDTSTAVWPQAGSATRYTEPVAAAKGLAVDFLGFQDPVVGEYMAGDSRSGEVEIRPTATGPVTTVFVRQLGDTWFALGAATDNIRVTSPGALDAITSPVHLTGTSTAFEANVGVLIYEDGSMTPLAQNFVMGGSMGEFGPFDANIEFTTPHASTGSVVFFTRSMEDGRMWEAGVLRVRFGS